MKKIFINTLIILPLFSIFIFLAPSQSFAADTCDANGDGTVSTQEAIQCGADGASGTTQKPADATDQLNGTIKDIINILSAAVGVAAVIMIIIGGFRYITSGGSTEKITSAKNTILYALIGLVVVALAQVIVRFVLTRATTDCFNHKTPSGQKC